MSAASASQKNVCEIPDVRFIFSISLYFGYCKSMVTVVEWWIEPLVPVTVTTTV
jgi:hypothetical protein